MSRPKRRASGRQRRRKETRMIDPEKFAKLAEDMRRAAEKAVELASVSREKQSVALKARKEADEAAERWRAYCAEEAKLTEMPNLFLLGV